ncbi:regulator of G-protein signaling 5-like [Latimeria chalumnae]|uniref:regulator of G-protein signaling 5-like n=1 Tax=Latimeria chalumnae TaxID=7897 RepID=UPI0003C14A99
MSSGLCNCFLLRRHRTPRRSTVRAKESRTRSHEQLMPQELVYQEISVSSLPEQPVLEPTQDCKSDPFAAHFSAFQSSGMLIDTRQSSKTPEKAIEKKTSKTLAKEMKTRLSFLLQKPETSSEQIPPVEEKDETIEQAGKLSHEEALEWGRSLDVLLTHKHGLAAFRAFLHTEFSEENIDFWVACEDFKNTKSRLKVGVKARKIFAEFVGFQAPKEINLDSHTREVIMRNLPHPTIACFDTAQKRIYSLMEKDSYPRFLKSHFYLDLVKQLQT